MIIKNGNRMIKHFFLIFIFYKTNYVSIIELNGTVEDRRLDRGTWLCRHILACYEFWFIPSGILLNVRMTLIDTLTA